MLSLNVFVHLTDLPSTKYITTDILNNLESSELINVANINLCCNYDKTNYSWLTEKYQNFQNIKFIFDQNHPLYFEIPTLNRLKEFCDNQKEESYILYLHHKGASNPLSPNLDDWRKFMLYYNVQQYKNCIEKLDQGYDTVGVNWKDNPYPHYSGNYWWAKSSYIKKLKTLEIPKTIHDKSQFGYDKPYPYIYRYDAEIWLGSGSPNSYNFYNSNIDHYRQRFLPKEYVNNKN